MYKFSVFAYSIILGGFMLTTMGQGLKGTVTDEAGKPIKNAILWLNNHPAIDTSDESGTFDFGQLTGVHHSIHTIQREQPVFNKNSLSFIISVPRQLVRLDIYSLSGKRVKTIVNDMLSNNNYTVSLVDIGLPSAVYIVNLQIGPDRYLYQMVVQGLNTIQFTKTTNLSANFSTSAKIAEFMESSFDVLHCEVPGYINQEKAIPSYNVTVNLVMIEADTTPPTIKFLGDDTVWCKIGDDSLRSLYFRKDTWKLEITDNRDTGTDIIIVAPTSTSIDSTIPGIHWIKYSAIDLSHNSGDNSRMLILYNATIIDTEPPVLTVIPEIVEMAVGELWLDTGVTVKDVIDSTIDLSLWISRECTGTLTEETPPTFTASTIGTYTITYKVIDTHKNLATKVRTFNVKP